MENQERKLEHIKNRITQGVLERSGKLTLKLVSN